MRAIAQAGNCITVDYRKSMLEVNFETLALAIWEALLDGRTIEQWWKDYAKHASWIFKKLPSTE